MTKALNSKGLFQVHMYFADPTLPDRLSVAAYHAGLSMSQYAVRLVELGINITDERLTEFANRATQSPERPVREVWNEVMRQG